MIRRLLRKHLQQASHPNKYSPEFDISIQFVLLPSFSPFLYPAPTYSENSPTTVMNLSSTTNTFASTFRSLLILSLSLHLPEPHSSALVSSVLSAYTIENRICSKFFRIRYGKSRMCPLLPAVSWYNLCISTGPGAKQTKDPTSFHSFSLPLIFFITRLSALLPASIILFHLHTCRIFLFSWNSTSQRILLLTILEQWTFWDT